MSRLVRTWMPQVGVCLLLQGGLVSGGALLHHWVDAPSPCCDRHRLI
ncbi:MAG: hypothetical protein ACKO0M_04395 [Cyanobium sp.]